MDFKLSVLLFVLSLALHSCIPEPDPYPFKAPAIIRAEAQIISDRLTTYIEGWLDGVNPAMIPDSLIPNGIIDAVNFELIHPDSMPSEDVWAWRYAQSINTDSIYSGLPDPNVTYLLLGPSLAPYGSKVHIEGEFPHCRFFSVQITPPLSGEEYTYNKVFGSAEVSIVDVDIDPLPGHINPFRIGADRGAIHRSYHLTFDLEIGDPVALSSGNFAPPYRYPGNTRFGGLIHHQGPWGIDGGFAGITPGNGEWNTGAIWLRYYAPDGEDPTTGIDFPKIWYELADGRRYFIRANFQEFFSRVNRTIPAQESYTNPNPNISVDVGWAKSYGILMNILGGVSLANGWLHPDTSAKIRAVDLGATGRSQFAPPPRNYEAHATINNYASYTGKSIRLDTGEVLVLTGKLPTFPNTRNGLSAMEAAQCRYWSIVGYDNDPFFEAPGSAINSIMDDEVLIDEYRNFMICYSRTEDWPMNASPENGVSWVSWGPTMELGLIMRYVNIADDWEFEYSPNTFHLPWSTGNLASPTFDSTLIFQNWHKGFMNCYLPRVHIMKKAQFEALGNSFQVDDIPILVHDGQYIGLNDALDVPIIASSFTDDDTTFAPLKANDNNFDSYWASQTLSTPEQTEWIQLDLGAERKISGVKLSWNFLAHATAYDLQYSSDATNWTSFFTTQNGNGQNDIVDHLAITGRYVRVLMHRCILFQYQLRNIEVYYPASECLNMPIITSQSSTQQAIDFVIFPNPSSGTIHFKVPLSVNPRQVQVFSSNGSLLMNTAFEPSLQLSLPSGIYFIALEVEGRMVVKRVIITE
ncbi:MAG: discoidin domain-containing protein [Bacteroidota bacterium]